MRHGRLLLLSAALLTGCGGGSSSSPSRLQIRATRVCAVANHHLQRITTTKVGYAAFLQQGLALLQPELRQLESLHAGAGDQEVYSGALDAIGREIKELKRALAALEHHQDPALAFTALQSRLAPLESQANAAWRALQIPGCASR